MTRFAPFLLALPALASALPSAELTPETAAAFDRYIQAAEARLRSRVGERDFIRALSSPASVEKLRRGEVVVETGGDTGARPPHGRIHDWAGATFIPGATMEKTLAFVQDYNRHKDTHKPEVVDSKLLSRNGNDFKISFRLRKTKIVTVVLDTDYSVHYEPAGENRWQSQSYSTRIQEVENPGKPDERRLPAGRDHGFLWRLYSYWRFLERDGGVYIECHAISLSRAVPAGFGWLIEPITRELPKESLIGALRSTRNALLQAAP